MTPARHACAALLALLAAWPPAAGALAESLRFRIVEGRVLNAFHQDGDVAAHLLLSSGDRPRILAAFPAGNSGVGVWFRASAEPAQWTLETLRSERRPDAEGRPLRGISADANVTGGPLRIRDAVLGSVRVLRDYQLGTAYPPDTRASPQVAGDTVRWRRDRIDGAPGYEIALQVLDGELRRDSGSIVLAPDRDGAPIRLRITALTGEPPLTPLAPAQLFAARPGDDLHSRQALRFLSYREKFLAGSWRFDTYFGRDTLMSLRLLMPALRPEAVEAGLASVLERLDADGEVAHEEDIGEFAVLRHRREGAPAGRPDAPIYDYKMVDDDFMLAPVAAAWLLDHPEGRRRAHAFLSRRLDSGETAGAALARNFGFVLRSARAFAKDPAARNLVPLKPGHNVGQWRDSEDGLAGGRYAYDVNAVFVPAALRAIARFASEGLPDARLTPDQGADPGEADALARAWSARAPPLFAVELAPAEARAKVREYARRAGVDPEPALASLEEMPLRFPALALRADGMPIPVLHSDPGFALLFSDPDPAALEALVPPLLRPFPAGLLTGAGMLVANPAYASSEVQQAFGRNAYHGTVVWSWQQALMAAGLQRQLGRDDLPESTRARLRTAQSALWDAIDATRATRTSELWSWSYADGRYRMAPFGQSSGDADESNAAQLWSTVYLAVRRP